MTVQCCKCKKLRVKGEWIRPSTVPSDMVSHTYCPRCLEETRSEMFVETGLAERVLPAVVGTV